jgi:hypothetical protein
MTKSKKQKKKIKEDGCDLPPPCIVLNATWKTLWFGFCVIMFSYVAKALYMMNVNKETLWQTLWRVSFWKWDIYFVWDILFLIFIIYLVILCIYAIRRKYAIYLVNNPDTPCCGFLCCFYNDIEAEDIPLSTSGNDNV